MDRSLGVQPENGSASSQVVGIDRISWGSQAGGVRHVHERRWSRSLGCEGFSRRRGWCHRKWLGSTGLARGVKHGASGRETSDTKGSTGGGVGIVAGGRDQRDRLEESGTSGREALDVEGLVGGVGIIAGGWD